MKRELKKEELSKLYKEFSRQKYNKYKHQFPRMRESELVAKIIKEWEAMNVEDRRNLYQSFAQNKELPDDKSESSQKKESPGSSKEKKKKSQSKSKVVAGPTDTPSKQKTVQVFYRSSSSKKEKAQSQSSDFARDGAKKDFQISQSDSKELGTKTGKTKTIGRPRKENKQPRTEYLKFFKFYYDKLTKQHPKWAALQISTIIKLLWKKKTIQDRAVTRSSSKFRRQPKETSARRAFRNHHSYNGVEALQRWKQLPRENRLYWKIVGKGYLSLEKKVLGPTIKSEKSETRTRKGSDNSSKAEPNTYMHKPMI